MPEVLVVTVNYERPADTLACLDSIFHSEGNPLKVLVVDNGSKDDSIHQIQQAFPQVRIESLPENTGFTGGFNHGIELALQSGAEDILLANNDTIFDRRAILELSQAEWDVAVPKILFYNQPSLIWSAGCRWRKFPPSVVMRGYRKADSLPYDIPTPLEYATGCVLRVKRQVFETTGGFDADYRYYMEDYDFCARVRQAGFTLGYVPTARVLHKVSQTLGLFATEQSHSMGRNTVLFYRKTKRFPLWQLWVFLTWVSLRELVQGRAAYAKNYWVGARSGFQWIRQAPQSLHQRES